MEEKFKQGDLYFRQKENFLKELLYKFKILKHQYHKLGKIKEIKIERRK